MSWQVYVDSNLLGTGKIAHAAILGQASGGSVWAKSANLKISDKEVKAIVAGFNDYDSIRASGIRVNDVKYMTLQAMDGHIYGKKGADGVIAVQTKQAVLLGLYVEGTQPGDATKIVEDLADYLKGTGY